MVSVTYGVRVWGGWMGGCVRLVFRVGGYVDGCEVYPSVSVLVGR